VQIKKLATRAAPSDGTTALDVTLIGEADDKTIAQMVNCVAVEEGAKGVLLPDNHLGYSQPIGGAVAYRNLVSPSGVGFDIGCGNKAVRTNILFDDIADDMPRIMDEIFDKVSFGMGRFDGDDIDHPVLDKIADAPFRPQRELAPNARKQLGTVGGGNHYVDLFRDEEDIVWVGVHFGSRGFGHNTATGFLALAQGLPFSPKDRRAQGVKVSEGDMMSPPVTFEADSGVGEAYIEAMKMAGEFAYAGRDVVVDKVMNILAAEPLFEVHNHHNFAWHERHGGEDWWVVRKGCTPAFPGQMGFVGATMAENSVILEGTQGTEPALFSTVHGAGRAMSRNEAAGKQRKRWSCNNRDCDWFQGQGEHKPKTGACPKCGHPKLSKRMVRFTKGKVDWEAEQSKVRELGIELRGAAADEAAPAYKRLNEVLAAQGDAIHVRHVLTPVGVAMAAADTADPWKD
jgi:tRNA-splicing ligase RtcB